MKLEAHAWHYITTMCYVLCACSLITRLKVLSHYLVESTSFSVHWLAISLLGSDICLISLLIQQTGGPRQAHSIDSSACFSTLGRPSTTSATLSVNLTTRIPTPRRRNTCGLRRQSTVHTGFCSQYPTCAHRHHTTTIHAVFGTSLREQVGRWTPLGTAITATSTKRWSGPKILPL